MSSPPPNSTGTRTADDDRRRKAAGLALLAAAALGIAVLIAVLAASIRQSPGLEGILTGLFAGLFACLLVTLGGAWIAVQLVRDPKANAQPDHSAGDVLRDQLSTVLNELEAARRDTRSRIWERASLRVPLAVAAGLGLWVVGTLTDEVPDYEALVSILVVAGLAGFVWSAEKLSSSYDALYKSRVLPALARSLGGLTYEPIPSIDIDPLHRHRLFRSFDSAAATDGFSGTLRGLPVSIAQLKLKAGGGDNEVTVFDGLLLQVDLTRRLKGVTAVIHDAGNMGNLRDRLSGPGLERVRLEDPLFERRYEIYSDNQVESRALLNPAFMERLLALGDGPNFQPPQALAQDSRLTLAMPQRRTGDLFRPPGYLKPADCRATLTRLQEDLKSLIAAADAVIALDEPGRVRQS